MVKAALPAGMPGIESLSQVLRPRISSLLRIFFGGAMTLWLPTRTLADAASHSHG